MQLLCPICNAPLLPEERRFFCPTGHSFDRARSGYVNLLQRQSHRQRGDDSQMVAARHAFLEDGWYRRLLDAIYAQVMTLPITGTAQLLDLGCGEGWYSCNILQKMQSDGQMASLAGIDISPDALRYAANRAKAMVLPDTLWAAAGINRLPLADGTVDCIFNLFAPYDAAECARVLRANGTLLRAIPLERHLWELKRILYAKPYENRPKLSVPDPLHLEHIQRIEAEITLSGASLQNLFAMTPYAHNTSLSDMEKLSNLESLTVQLAFGLLVCKKRSSNGFAATT